MTLSIRTFSLSALLAAGLLATPLLAQEAPAPETPATDAPAADAPAPVVGDAPVADGLSMGTDADAPAQDGPGSVYVAAVFDAWEQRCVRSADGSDPCQLYQLLKDAQGNSVAEFSLFSLPEGGEATAGATIIAPLETLLTANLTMRIDGGNAKVYPFTFCAQVGCVARVGFTAAEVEQFKKGARAILVIVPVVAPEEKVELEVSLKGFTAGYTAVKASLDAAAPAAP